MIGDSVEVKILGLRAGQIKIGIEAPRDLSIHREEVYERIRTGNSVDHHAEFE